MTTSYQSDIRDERLLLAEYTDALRVLLAMQLKRQFDRQIVVDEVKRLSKFGLWKLSELAHALLACNCQLLDLNYPRLQLNQRLSGAVPLFEKLSFAWGRLPYPRYHAELGGLLALLTQKGGDESYLKIAKKMGEWQLTMLDHRGLPIFGCWCQEGSHSYTDLLLANYFLFNTLSFTPFANTLFDTISQRPKIDSSLEKLAFATSGNQETLSLPESQKNTIETPHFIRRCTSRSTIMGFGSGCKSGMGLFLHQEGGVVSFGPGQLPLGDFATFGIASDPHVMQKGGFTCECVGDDDTLTCHFAARLAGVENRSSGYTGLKSEGFSGIWVEGTHEITDKKLSISCQFEGVGSCEKLRFIFLAKGKGITVSKSHHLKPNSLDRYVGPHEQITLELEKSKMILDAPKGVAQMEIIPLSDDENFFSATFLIAYTLEGEYHTWTLAINESEYHSCVNN